MNIKTHIISEDLELINAFKDIPSLAVKTIQLDSINDSGADVLIVSNKIIDLRNLLTIKNTNKKCFYLSDDGDLDDLKKIDSGVLSLREVIIVPPKRTVSQIQEFILNNILEVDSENNVFTFFGTDSKVGTTSIAQLIAINLAKRHKNKSVIMLFLDGQTGFDWIDSKYTKYCLADIKVALRNNLLTSANLKENCYQYAPNLFMLKGEIAIKDNVYYHQNEINSLINLCKDNFDFVIVDAGNTMNLQLRMTYSALINSDNKILVTDQLNKSYEMYIKGKNQILEDLKIDDFKFIILNKYIKNNILFKKEEIIDKYELAIVSTLPYIEFYYQAASEKNISMFETEKIYKEGINTVVEYIEKKRGIIPENNKESIFSFKKKRE